MLEGSVEHSPGGSLPSPLPAVGDFILCHRRGFVSWCIRAGERIKHGRKARWSHAAFCCGGTTIIEALTHGVTQDSLEEYRDIEFDLVRTALAPEDAMQAAAFAASCIGETYGFVTDLGTALRFITPGRGLWFGMNGTEMCSGLVAQAQVRGWSNFKYNPACMSPEELGYAYGV